MPNRFLKWFSLWCANCFRYYSKKLYSCKSLQLWKLANFVPLSPETSKYQIIGQSFCFLYQLHAFGAYNREILCRIPKRIQQIFQITLQHLCWLHSNMNLQMTLLLPLTTEDRFMPYLLTTLRILTRFAMPNLQLLYKSLATRWLMDCRSLAIALIICYG